MIELDTYTTQKVESKIRAMLKDSVVDMFEANDVWIAGGALTSLFSNKEVNDLDIYFGTQEGLDNVLSDVYGFGEYLSGFELTACFATDRSFTTRGKDQVKVQFIYYKTFKDAQAIFDAFDYTINMCAYSFKEKKFYMHDDFMVHLAQRYLKFNDGTDFPFISVLRAGKYVDRGYQISKSEMLRVVFAAAKINLKSWEDAISHIGSMYGIEPEYLFDRQKEFSLEELIEQLSAIDLDAVTTTPKVPTFYDVATKCVACSEQLREFAKARSECRYRDSWFAWQDEKSVLNRDLIIEEKCSIPPPANFWCP